jgi:hypothetical protein
MIPWTETAAKIWEDFCRRTRENLRGSGADADEVVDDLRRHVEEEIRASKLSVVTEEDMRQILARVGEPAAAETAPQSGKKGALQWMFLIFALVFGILLPAGTLLFEIFTGVSASVLFDPIPTWFQILAAAMVPLTNFWLWLVVYSGQGRWPRLLGWLSGSAAGVAAFYMILYLPFAPFAAMAVIYFGIGLIPLAPYFALLVALLLRSKARRTFRSGQFGRFWPAFGTAFLALALAQAPSFLTFRGLARAASDDSATRRSGVNMLRHFGKEELLLRSCYGMDRFREPTFDVVRWLASGDTPVPADKAREIYFRATGRPFNSVPPPSLYTRAGRLNLLDDDFDFSWDDALGGEAVAGRVKGLSLQSSRLDAIAEPDAAVVYCEWTMEFKNVSPQQREARAQIVLPPDGVVSRLTLWVNGEEREAAFGGRSQTRQAYQQVAVQQRRDPVLVTTCGPDRVLMQCFPVPPNGGTLKVRIGITAPLMLDSPGRGAFQWPEFLERNFKIPQEFKHAVWIESPRKVSCASSTLVAAGDTHKFSLRGNLAEGSLGGVLVDRPAETRAVWTPALADGQLIRQRIEESAQPVASRIVLVIDGSANMKPWADSLADAVRQIPSGTEIALFMADDSASASAAPSRADGQTISSIASRLKHFHFSGGCDNLPALEQGWDLAAAAEHGVVIWIHDAQPVLLSPADSLRQRMERGAKSIPVFDLQLRAGPNRIAEQLDGLRLFKTVLRMGGAPGDGLKHEFDVLEGKIHPLEFIRDCVTNSIAEGPQVSRHIERLWARDEAAQLASARRAGDASKLAAGHQLVTPFSGAVVLETKQQYAQNNLTPAAAETVPIVPEPSTWGLFAVGGAFVFWQISKRRLARTANKSLNSSSTASSSADET